MKNPGLETILRRWWVKKYKLPWTHELAQSATYSELLIEYYEDWFEESPSEARKALTGEDGEYYFETTGDPLIDKWEDEVRRGLIPDLEEGLHPREKAKLAKEREMAKRGREAARELGKPDPRLASKFVVPGTEKQVLGSGQGPAQDSLWEDLLGRD